MPGAPSVSWLRSSPRAWGTAFPSEARPVSSRFIPTCVGNRQCQELFSAPPHGSSPRAWGTACESPWFDPPARSSPRAWGTGLSKPAILPQCGSSPRAWGTGDSYIAAVVADGSSPRAWEQASATDASRGPIGSSPRAWGTGSGSESGVSWLRFIPTCVGNSGRLRAEGTDAPVHPHVRGGTGYSTWTAWTLYWFIPTCVGEQLVRHGEKLLTLGSSPRAWGTVTESTHGVDKVRFIPTCVGNRFSMEHIYTLSPVHPHVRGEILPTILCVRRSWKTVVCPPVFRRLLHPSLMLSKSRHSELSQRSVQFPGEAKTRPA